MIKEELKNLIKPNALIHMPKEDWDYLDVMFTETYLTYHEGIERVSLKPHPEAGRLSMQFSTLNGAFIELTDWDYIKKVGRRL